MTNNRGDASSYQVIGSCLTHGWVAAAILGDQFQGVECPADVHPTSGVDFVDGKLHRVGLPPSQIRSSGQGSRHADLDRLSWAFTG